MLRPRVCVLPLSKECPTTSVELKVEDLNQLLELLEEKVSILEAWIRFLRYYFIAYILEYMIHVLRYT